jgi:DNA-binding NarL/FixJ family response regulator
MLRVYVSVAVRERILCDTLKAALRGAECQIVDELEGNPPVNVVIVPVDSVDSSCRLISHIIDHRPSSAVVALGEQCREDEIVALIEAGAKAYVDRSESFPQLLFTVHAVVQKRAQASGRITAEVVRKIRDLIEETVPRAPGGPLTQREQMILHLIAKGCSNKQIADHLAISSNTVKNHVHRVLEKLQVRGRREAARIALLSSVHTPAPVRAQLAGWDKSA